MNVASEPLPPPAGCISLLGLEGGGIAESQISASSVRYTMLGLQRWGPELARLHNKGLVNAWSAATHDKNPWIEVRRGDRQKLNKQAAHVDKCVHVVML